MKVNECRPSDVLNQHLFVAASLLPSSPVDSRALEVRSHSTEVRTPLPPLVSTRRFPFKHHLSADRCWWVAQDKGPQIISQITAIKITNIPMTTAAAVAGLLVPVAPVDAGGALLASGGTMEVGTADGLALGGACDSGIVDPVKVELGVEGVELDVRELEANELDPVEVVEGVAELPVADWEEAVTDSVVAGDMTGATEAAGRVEELDTVCVVEDVKVDVNVDVEPPDAAEAAATDDGAEGRTKVVSGQDGQVWVTTVVLDNVTVVG